MVSPLSLILSHCPPAISALGYLIFYFYFFYLSKHVWRTSVIWYGTIILTQGPKPLTRPPAHLPTAHLAGSAHVLSHCVHLANKKRASRSEVWGKGRTRSWAELTLSWAGAERRRNGERIAGGAKMFAANDTYEGVFSRVPACVGVCVCRSWLKGYLRA